MPIINGKALSQLEALVCHSGSDPAALGTPSQQNDMMDRMAKAKQPAASLGFFGSE